jgi:arylamine N-acetyltransferase
LRVVKSRADGVLVLLNHKFTSYTAEGKQRRAVSGIEEYERLIRDEFELPHLPVRDALRAWQAIAGADLDAEA